MCVRYHHISLLKTAVNNVSVPDLSAPERTVWNFHATCIELGKLKIKSNVALCDSMMGWNCMRYKKKLVAGKLVEPSGNLDSAADVARGSVQMFLVLCSDFLLILIYT